MPKYLYGIMVVENKLNCKSHQCCFTISMSKLCFWNVSNVSELIHSVIGETDWKLIAIDINDPLAEELNGNWTFTLKENSVLAAFKENSFFNCCCIFVDIEDVEKHMPGFLRVNCHDSIIHLVLNNLFILLNSIDWINLWN